MFRRMVWINDIKGEGRRRRWNDIDFFPLLLLYRQKKKSTQREDGEGGKTKSDFLKTFFSDRHLFCHSIRACFQSVTWYWFRWWGKWFVLALWLYRFQGQLLAKKIGKCLCFWTHKSSIKRGKYGLALQMFGAVFYFCLSSKSDKKTKRKRERKKIHLLWAWKMIDVFLLKSSLSFFLSFRYIELNRERKWTQMETWKSFLYRSPNCSLFSFPFRFSRFLSFHAVIIWNRNSLTILEKDLFGSCGHLIILILFTNSLLIF